MNKKRLRKKQKTLTSDRQIDCTNDHQYNLHKISPDDLTKMVLISTTVIALVYFSYHIPTAVSPPVMVNSADKTTRMITDK